ncbi:restless-like transposase [Apiospora phragmitis]|uniref:Restless-like transposase n=1 Tax=Apiospora phragmitis TaxID=2905665 RepID=A0ABR1VC98_9PEZI
MGHLYTHHNIKAPSDMRKSRKERGDETRYSQRRTITTFLNNLNPDNSNDVILMHKIHDSFDKTHFQRLLVEWIVNESLPFRLVDTPGFRALCSFLNPQIETQQAILSRNSIRSRIVTEFHRHHQRVIDYKIGHKVGYFTLDNASNMDTAMDFIGNAYKFNGRRRRGRCFGHILNLAAKALLDPSASASEGIREFDDNDTLTDADYERWRQQGPVGKLRIIVIAIDQSDRINDLFRYVQEADSDRSKRPLRLVKDNQTRWLGTYYMIKRAIRLRQYIEITRTKYNNEWTKQHTSPVTGTLRFHASKNIPISLQPANQLSDLDWDALTRIASILSDFEDCLIQLEGDGQIRRRSGGFEGSYGNIYHYLSGFEFILQKLEQYKADLVNYPEPAQYGIRVNAAWGKINGYYANLQTTPIYYAAHIFHLLQHWKSLECLWATNADWVHDAKQLVKGVWDTEYNNLDGPNPRPATPTVTQPNISVNSFTSFLQQQRNRASRAHDEERDNEAGIINDIDPMFLCVTAEQDRQDVTDPTMDEAGRKATSWLRSGDMEQHYV